MQKHIEECALTCAKAAIQAFESAPGTSTRGQRLYIAGKAARSALDAMPIHCDEAEIIRAVESILHDAGFLQNKPIGSLKRP